LITAQIETLSQCLEELKELFPSHWEELGLFRDKMPLAPQYDLYWERERQGQLVAPIVRKDGKIIAYWPTMVAPGLHYGTTLTATMDILWVHPDHRGDGVGTLLFETLKTELKRRGVKIWWAGSKNHKEIEWFLKMLGFKAEETYFALWIGD
jgi:GNAT superfamily N-acetyltransferase